MTSAHSVSPRPANNWRSAGYALSLNFSGVPFLSTNTSCRVLRNSVLPSPNVRRFQFSEIIAAVSSFGKGQIFVSVNCECCVYPFRSVMSSSSSPTSRFSTNRSDPNKCCSTFSHCCSMSEGVRISGRGEALRALLVSSDIGAYGVIDSTIY